MLELGNFPPDTQARILSRFLFELTVGVRDIHTAAETHILQQLYGVNQIYHMVIPFIDSIIYGDCTTYTIEVVMQNLVEMAPSYGIERQVAIAWESARSYASGDQEGGGR